MRLPPGVHRLRIERASFIAYERTVVIPQGGTTRLQVELQPTADYRADYRRSAQRRRTGSLIGVGLGGAVTVGGAVFVAVNSKNQSDREAGFDREEARYRVGGECEPGTMTPASCNPDRLEILLGSLQDARDREKFAWITLGVGAATIGASVALLLTGKDPGRYEPKGESDVFAKRRWRPGGWASREGGGFSFVSEF